MLLFEVREKSVRGDKSQAFICPHCQSKSSRLVSTLRTLSFAMFSLFPIKQKHGAQCTCCNRITYHKHSTLFPKIHTSYKVTSFVGSFALAGFALLASSYANFLHEHQEQVRVAPIVGDILFVKNDGPTHSVKGLQMPYRMAKVVKVEPELNAVALTYSSFTYDSNNSINRDFVGKNYLFDSYFKQNVELVPVTKLSDKEKFYDTKRPLNQVYLKVKKAFSQFNQGVKLHIQQTNELTRLFQLFS